MITRETGKTIRESREEMVEYTADHFRRAGRGRAAPRGPGAAVDAGPDAQADPRRPGARRRRRGDLALELPGRHRRHPDRLRPGVRLHDGLEAVRARAALRRAVRRRAARGGLPAGHRQPRARPRRRRRDWSRATATSRSVVFTGSVATGEKVARDAGLKNRILELGGNGPQIVLADANLEAAADAAVMGCFYLAGQVLHRRRARARAPRRARPLRRAPGREDEGAAHRRPARRGHRHGPDVQRRSRSRARSGTSRTPSSRARRSCTAAARTACTTSRRSSPASRARWRSRSEETFGPGRADHALRHARRGDRDRQRDRVRPHRGRLHEQPATTPGTAASELRHGTVHINETTNYWDQMAPFGGAKSSGSGRELAGGIADAVTETKQITFDWSRGPSRAGAAPTETGP